MKITLELGDKLIVIEKYKEEGEQDSTWIEVAEDLIFPALRGYGYIIDDEFSNSLEELHQEYLDKKYTLPWKRKE
jgi:hypothetical protein